MSDIDDMAAEIVRLRKEREWRDIATAPKDGARILVSFGTLGVWCVAWTEGAHNDWHSWCVDDRKHGPYPLRGWVEKHHTEPSHWMPLPLPPPPEKENT